jgi:hypothetical protein
MVNVIVFVSIVQFLCFFVEVYSSKPHAIDTSIFLKNIDGDFKSTIGKVSKLFGVLSVIQKFRKPTHTTGILSRGHLEIDNVDSSIPQNELLRRGAKFRLLLRHANTKGKPDDAISDVL